MSGPIIAMGGAEFIMRPQNEALHDYVLATSAKPRPKICLLPTASGDPQEQITSFHAAMDRRECEASSISLFRLGESTIDVARHLLDQDIVYVTGGNMVNLMALWREHGLIEILRGCHEQGTVLCGYSAGSMCWFDYGVSRGVGKPVVTEGIGLIEGSHCVHYSQDPSRRDAYRQVIASGEIPRGIALDDYAAALFRDGKLVESVIGRQSSGSRWVEEVDGEAVETPIETRLLDPPPEPRETSIEEMRELRAMRSRRR